MNISSISIAIFQVFGMTRLWLELTTSRSGGERSTFTLPVGLKLRVMDVWINEDFEDFHFIWFILEGR